MNDREKRLRERIDRLTDERDQARERAALVPALRRNDQHAHPITRPLARPLAHNRDPRPLAQALTRHASCTPTQAKGRPWRPNPPPQPSPSRPTPPRTTAAKRATSEIDHAHDRRHRARRDRGLRHPRLLQRLGMTQQRPVIIVWVPEPFMRNAPTYHAFKDQSPPTTRCGARYQEGHGALMRPRTRGRVRPRMPPLLPHTPDMKVRRKPCIHPGFFVSRPAHDNRC